MRDKLLICFCLPAPFEKCFQGGGWSWLLITLSQKQKEMCGSVQFTGERVNTIWSYASAGKSHPRLFTNTADHISPWDTNWNNACTMSLPLQRGDMAGLENYIQHCSRSWLLILTYEASWENTRHMGLWIQCGYLQVLENQRVWLSSTCKYVVHVDNSLRLEFQAALLQYKNDKMCI